MNKVMFFIWPIGNAYLAKHGFVKFTARKKKRWWTPPWYDTPGGFLVSYKSACRIARGEKEVGK